MTTARDVEAIEEAVRLAANFNNDYGDFDQRGFIEDLAKAGYLIVRAGDAVGQPAEEERRPMTWSPECDYCGKPLEKPGALLFTPPNPMVMKLHLCVGCLEAEPAFAAFRDMLDGVRPRRGGGDGSG